MKRRRRRRKTWGGGGGKDEGERMERGGGGGKTFFKNPTEEQNQLRPNCKPPSVCHRPMTVTRYLRLINKGKVISIWCFRDVKHNQLTLLFQACGITGDGACSPHGDQEAKVDRRGTRVPTHSGAPPPETTSFHSALPPDSSIAQ